MEKIGFNMAVKNFKAGIINKTNDCGLPISVSLLVLKELITELEKEAEKITNIEIEEYNTRKEKEHGQGNNANSVEEQTGVSDGIGSNQTE